MNTAAKRFSLPVKKVDGDELIDITLPSGAVMRAYRGVDEHGRQLYFLDDYSKWTKEWADVSAKLDGTDLTENHWEVLKFLREYYGMYQISPMIKILIKEMAKTMGPEKGDTKYLYELYPDGPSRQACRYAGLRKPTGCM